MSAGVGKVVTLPAEVQPKRTGSHPEATTYIFVASCSYSIRQIRFSFVDYGIRLYMRSPLQKITTTLGSEANTYTPVPEGVALDAPHERPPDFTSSIPTRCRAQRTMQALVEMGERCGPIASGAFQSNSFGGNV